MMQDRTANTLTCESALPVTFERGNRPAGRKRGYWITGGAFLGVDATSARKTLKSVDALLAFSY